MARTKGKVISLSSGRLLVGLWLRKRRIKSYLCPVAFKTLHRSHFVGNFNCGVLPKAKSFVWISNFFDCKVLIPNFHRTKYVWVPLETNITYRKREWMKIVHFLHIRIFHLSNTTGQLPFLFVWWIDSIHLLCIFCCSFFPCFSSTYQRTRHGWIASPGPNFNQIQISKEHVDEKASTHMIWLQYKRGIEEKALS